MLHSHYIYIRPIVEFGSTVWNTGYHSDLRLLERVQRAWTKQIAGHELLSYRDRLLSLNLYSIKGRLLRADLILMWKIFHHASTIQPVDLFSLEVRPGNRGHLFKIRPDHIQTEQRRRFICNRCINVWNGLPADVVSSPSVAVFKRKLHEALGELLFEYID